MLCLKICSFVSRPVAAEVAAHAVEVTTLTAGRTFSEAFGCGRPEGGLVGADGTIDVSAGTTSLFPVRTALRPAPAADVFAMDCIDAIDREFFSSRASAVAIGRVNGR